MKSGDLGVVDKVMGRFFTPTRTSNLHKILKPPQGKNSDFDPQTEADRSVQQCIVASLAKKYPTLKVIGEEGISDLTNIPADFVVSGEDQDFLSQYQCPESWKNVAENELVVWVDPLDGTSEYVHG